jgi:hypothetical protein
MSETPKRRKTRRPITTGAASAPPTTRPYRERFTSDIEGRAAGIRAWAGGAALPQDMSIVFGLVLPAMLLAANMWRVHTFTIDDSFISYRYARNLARGLGLVYNAGEHIEGYTNFLFTVILAGGIKLGIDPELLSKGIGASSAFGALGLTFAISGRLRAYQTLPCVATWLLASTIVFSGWSVFGLETGFFLCLVLGGTYLLLRESGNFGHEQAPAATGASGSGPRSSLVAAAEAPAPRPSFVFPWSGVVFALAGLTRPEAPLFFLLLTPFLGRRFFTKENALRYALFVGPVLLHYLWRHSYYGAWIPNTAMAKTGNFEGQMMAGRTYIENYFNHAGPVLYLALLGAAFGLAKLRRDVIALTVVGAVWLAYVVGVGGDWMKLFRFMSPFEPFCFILIDLGIRRMADRRDLATNLALLAFGGFTVYQRAGVLRDDQTDFIKNEKHFWDTAGGGTAKWLLQHEPGELALGDIGYIGWATDYPILDLLGLVDPVISKLPGGYTQKIGPVFLDRFFDKKSKYFLLISSNVDCQHPSVTGSIAVWNDRRFRQHYRLGGTVPLDGGFAWCIYQRNEP